MRIALAIVLALHGLIHFMGFAKAFDLARLDALTQPISRPMGVLWLVAGLLLLAADLTLFAAPRWFWLVAVLALVASQLVIVTAWSDARFGTLANLLVAACALYGAFAWGPFGLAGEYRRVVADAVARQPPPAPPITEADLAPLPALVQGYLRYAGVVGQPRPRAFRARFRGRIRGAADAPWMTFVAEQHNFYDPPRRFFWMDATRGGLPVDVFHRFDDAGASMRVRLLSLITMVDQRGEAMTRTETVTLLNDMAIFAPGTLVDPTIRWHELDARRVEATYTSGPNTIRAVLVFDDAGALVDFTSDDRPALATDGATLLPQRWSTPIAEYRPQGPLRLASRGEGRYAPASGEYAYIEMSEIEVTNEITEPPR